MSKARIIVVGGGPSGMAAAITAARRGAPVLLLEGQARVGRKLLSTGNGRCNITNAGIGPERYRSGSPKAVSAVLDAVPPEEVTEFLRSLGLECFEEREGRIYPRSEQAASVLDMLRAELERLGVETVSECRVESITPAKGGFSLKAGERTFTGGAVIMACGSPASPQLGGCPDGAQIMKKLGHHPAAFSPALVGLKVDSPHLRSLKGVRWRCRLSLLHNGRAVHSEAGEIQFNEDNLSGIVTMQMSSRAARLKGSCELSADLLPEYDRRQTAELITELRGLLGHMPLESFLSGLLNKRLAVCLLKQAGVTKLDRPASRLTDRDIAALAGVIKDWRFPVTGNCGWKTAQVASGGIPLSEFDSCLRSTVVPGLYACGELLDCDGDCGGFNLHWAWCTGIIAGRAAAGEIRK